MTDKRLRALQKALKRRDEAEDHVLALLRHEYPVGAPLHWQGNSHVQSGYVLAHGNGNRLKVENHVTGRAYWIHVWRLRS